MISVYDKPTQKQQNIENNRLAAEYKEADEWRRHEIMTEYYKANTSFVNVWKNWERIYWPELTQNFVTYWHKAFSEYTPRDENSNFNLYMQAKFKPLASYGLKAYLKGQSMWIDLDYQTNDKGETKIVRKELLVHPTSAADREALRSKLSRCLDEKEKIIMDEFFFGGRHQIDVARQHFPRKDHKPGDSEKKKTWYSNEYNAKMHSLIVKVAANFTPEDIR